MSKIILKYILSNFFKYFFLVVLVIYGFGIILNLFEEIEFFKKLIQVFFFPFNANQYICSQYNTKFTSIYYFYF